jgi:hypothetical protein
VISEENCIEKFAEASERIINELLKSNENDAFEETKLSQESAMVNGSQYRPGVNYDFEDISLSRDNDSHLLMTPHQTTPFHLVTQNFQISSTRPFHFKII